MAPNLGLSEPSRPFAARRCRAPSDGGSSSPALEVLCPHLGLWSVGCESDFPLAYATRFAVLCCRSPRMLMLDKGWRGPEWLA